MAKKDEKKTDFNNPTRFVFGGKYYSILTIVTFPRELYPGFLANINSVKGVKLSIKHIPETLEELRNQITEEINDLKNDISNDRNSIMQQRYRDDIDDLTTYYNDLNEFNPRVFNFQMHLIVSGETDDELTERMSLVHTKLEGMDMKALPLMFEQDKVLMSCLPIFDPQEIEKRIGNLMPSYTIAAMYPFIFDCLKDAGCGTILGTDTSGGIILFNQYLYLEEQEPNRMNANTIIMGNNRSGKTSIAKLLLRSSLRNGHKCFYIDPDGDLNDFVVGMSGDYIYYGKGLNIINPLEVIADVDQNEMSQGLGYTALTRAINHFKAFLLYLSPTLTQDALLMLEKVLVETYARYNINTSTNFSTLGPNDFPVIDDLYATVRGKLVSMNEASPERTSLDMLEHVLRPFTTDLRGYFNGHTQINTYSDFVGFGFNLIQDDNLRNALMFNTIRYCYGKCLSNDKPKSLIIDKFEFLVTPANPYGLNFMAQIQRKSAKYLTGVTLLYEPNRFLSEKNLANEFKVLFENTSYYFITGLKKNVLDHVINWIGFNDVEKENVKYYQPGEALFICGRRRMSIRITLTPDELSEFNIQ